MESVYQIKNTENGKKYIGSTSDYVERVKSHLRGLRGGYHGNKKIQKDFDKYGEDAFEFEVLYEFEKGGSEERFNKEAEIIEKHKTYETGYNLTYDGRCRYVFTEETRKKIRENTSGSNNPMFGKSHTDRTKKLISVKASQRTGKLNHFYGKNHTEETRNKLSKKGKERFEKGLINPSNSRKVSVDGVDYRSVRQCARELEVHPSTVISRIKNDNFPNYKYIN